MSNHYQILIIGGGNAGISVAAQLLRKDDSLKLGIIEPSSQHYYQPAWTLVGGGVFDINDTVRKESECIPEGATWIQDAAVSFEPEKNQVSCYSGVNYTYDYLVVAPGIQLNWDAVSGLKETLGKNGVCSNYAFDQAQYTHKALSSVKPGDVVLFTSPATPVKCGGAPQKIMYLAADLFRKKGMLNNVHIEFVSGGSVIFGVEKYARSLMQLVKDYDIHLHFKHDLISIDGEKKTATFKIMDGWGGQTVTKHFDVIHVTPPQSVPDFIRKSVLANSSGWVDVDQYSLQHNRYPNIFGIGDATSTPNAKTGAAVRKQAPVLVNNLLSLMKGKRMMSKYNGYGSCPLVAGYGKLILAEFGYNNTIMETFPFDQSKPRWSMWMLKKYILPWMYWNQILKGKA